MVLSTRNVLIGIAVVAAGYVAYRAFLGDTQSSDVAALIRTHRTAGAARQAVIRRRIHELYEPDRHRDVMIRALDHTSPVTQALGVEVLAHERDATALPRLLAMLDDHERDDAVKEALAGAAAAFRSREAVPRLIELTDRTESLPVRSAAHNALKTITGAGGTVKLSDGTRTHWELWWANQKEE
jgi:HEAT repeat protein